jgi:urease accessory protein
VAFCLGIDMSNRPFEFRQPLLFMGTVALCLMPAIAQAHIGGDHGGGFSDGLQHPIGGLDHLLAMVAVGLWAAQSGGKARWALPIAFVTLMGLGDVLGMAQLPLPGIEAGILLSSLLLGSLILRAVQLPLGWSVGLVGSLALCHGFAHGLEMPAATNAWGYAAGFLLATAGLHLIGFGTAWVLQQAHRDRAIKWAGGLILLGGLVGIMSAISG